ncbi:MAG TPA: DinB family protein [Gemmatimonadaceae bacterium]|jgi:hypothetical protein|nr:DinB family protein [Gemmatimonadaceae bacterium]
MRTKLAGFLASALVIPALAAIPAIAPAQQSSDSASSNSGAGSAASSNPVSDALRTSLKRAEENLVAAAREMPAEKYSFSPTPAQMSFGKLVLHVAGANNFMCSTISGNEAPERSKLEPGDTKDKLVSALEQSFQYCNTALANLTDANLGEEVPFFGGRKISRASAVLGLAEDWGDHYSLAATELRLNGLLPPTAKRGEQ